MATMELRQAPSDPDAMNKLAGQLYATYCNAVGGVAHNGDKLPTWDEFSADSGKQKQVNGWMEVARATALLMQYGITDTYMSLHKSLGALTHASIDEECKLDHLRHKTTNRKETNG